LWRGAEPSPVGLQELSARGVKLVIDLRESGQDTLREKQQAEQLGMKYANLPFKPFSAPTGEQVRTVLFLLMNRGNNVIFVHCRRGKDRTGTVIACYRIQHDGWKNAKALEEARKFGMSRAERGMRSFVLNFSPFPNAGLIPPALSPAVAAAPQ
jgi:tyrosine-protein phosphatase SIW14